MRTDRTSSVEFEALWDANDVATYLKASRSWVYQKAEAGLLPSLRIGGLLRFEPGVVREWAHGGQPGAAVLPIRRSVP
jgi:excisionase family DNA binding protein